MSITIIDKCRRFYLSFLINEQFSQRTNDCSEYRKCTGIFSVIYIILNRQREFLRTFYSVRFLPECWHHFNNDMLRLLILCIYVYDRDRTYRMVHVVHATYIFKDDMCVLHTVLFSIEIKLVWARIYKILFPHISTSELSLCDWYKRLCRASMFFMEKLVRCGIMSSDKFA